MSNTNLKTRRQKSWLNARVRKQRRIAVQRGREAHNRELRAAGLPVPWEVACLQRAQRRLDAGLAAAWAKRQPD